LEVAGMMTVVLDLGWSHHALVLEGSLVLIGPFLVHQLDLEVDGFLEFFQMVDPLDGGELSAVDLSS
jgi:hypothetical protein